MTDKENNDSFQTNSLDSLFWSYQAAAEHCRDAEMMSSIQVLEDMIDEKDDTPMISKLHPEDGITSLAVPCRRLDVDQIDFYDM